MVSGNLMGMTMKRINGTHMKYVNKTVHIDLSFKHFVQIILKHGGMKLEDIRLVKDNPATYLKTSNDLHNVIKIDEAKDYYIELPFGITDIYSLYVLAHEVAHVYYKHLTDNNHLPLFVKEYQAEKWAITMLYTLGIVLSDTTIEQAKENVRYNMNNSTYKEDYPEVVEWCST